MLPRHPVGPSAPTRHRRAHPCPWHDGMRPAASLLPGRSRALDARRTERFPPDHTPYGPTFRRLGLVGGRAGRAGPARSEGEVIVIIGCKEVAIVTASLRSPTRCARDPVPGSFQSDLGTLDRTI